MKITSLGKVVMKQQHHLVLSALFLLLLQPRLAFAGKSNAVVMGAVGDSITQATNSTGWGDRPFDSWSTGENRSGLVDSHSLKLERLLKKPVVTYNVARRGATSQDLDKQLQALLPQKPDYVSLLLGANDACSWTDDYDADLLAYLSKMSDSVAALIAANPKVKILLLPVPNLNYLWELSHNQRGCQWLWDTLSICTPLLQSKRSPAERAAFSQRLADINTGLRSLAERFPSHINYKDELADYQFKSSHVSNRDCFHPSAAGQDLISSLSWDAAWVAELAKEQF